MNLKNFKKNGGIWLGIVRKWMQWNCKNGDRVQWNSNDILITHLTVNKIEDLAAEIGFAVTNDLNLKYQQQIENIVDSLYKAHKILNDGKPSGDNCVVMTKINDVIYKLKKLKCSDAIELEHVKK